MNDSCAAFCILCGIFYYETYHSNFEKRNRSLCCSTVSGAVDVLYSAGCGVWRIFGLSCSGSPVLPHDDHAGISAHRAVCSAGKQTAEKGVHDETTDTGARITLLFYFHVDYK